MNVSHRLPEVAVRLAKNRLVPPLKEANLLVLSVVILTVACQDPLHNPTDRVNAPLNEQMKMIRHQTVGIKIERKPGLLMFENRKEPEVVITRPEDAPAIIASGDQVIQTARDFDSGSPCHLTRILFEVCEVNM
jgi:hypothetical protein